MFLSKHSKQLNIILISNYYNPRSENLHIYNSMLQHLSNIFALHDMTCDTPYYSDSNCLYLSSCLLRCTFQPGFDGCCPFFLLHIELQNDDNAAVSTHDP